MTVSTQSSQITVSTGGSVGPFVFPFIGVSSSDIIVSSVTSNGIATPLLTSQYSISLNSPNPNSLWGVGGSVTLNSTPSYPNLIIQRLLPLTQNITTQNQGNYYAQVTEQALDLLEMQIQQGSSRTTQFRGIWQTGTIYNVGDIVQDGANGADTLNYYICEQANTSGTWSTDLLNGLWALSVLAVVPSTNLPITITGVVTGSGTTGINTSFGNQPPNSVLTNSSASTNPLTALTLGASTLLGRAASGSIGAIPFGTFFTSMNVQESSAVSGTYTPTSGMLYCIVELLGDGGGAGGFAGTGSNTGASSGGGAGSYTKALFTAAQIGPSQTFKIGQGGAGGVSGNNPGTAGTGSTFGITMASAPGGTAGNGGTTSASFQVISPGGLAAAGVVSNGTAISLLRGASGGYGTAYGGNGAQLGGWGGSSIYGQGGIPQTSANGSPGTGFGAGGGGTAGTTSSFSGGAGSPGILIVTEFI